MPSLLALVAVAVVAALFMSWSVGANSNSAPISPAVGADALSPRRAAILVGIVASLGAVAQGSNISHTIGHGLVLGVEFSPLAAAAALLTAASFIAVGVRTGYPIPAAFTVSGAVIGAGLALGGRLAVDTYLQILGFWFLIPAIEAAIAFVTAYVLVETDVPDVVTIPALAALVTGVVASVEFSFLPADAGNTLAGALAHVGGIEAPAVAGYPGGEVVVAASLALVGALAAGQQVVRTPERGVRNFLVALGLFVTFTSGGSQVGLAIGPLEAVVHGRLGYPMLALLALGGLGIVAGAWTGAPRLIRAVADEYADLGPYRSIAALVPAFLVAQTAIALGYPISFNKVMISAIVGAGYVGGVDAVSESKTGLTVCAWVGSMCGAAAVSFSLYHVFALLLG